MNRQFMIPSKVFFPLIFSISLLPIANASEINIETLKDGYNLELKGEIVQGDLARIRTKIRQQGRFPRQIGLKSGGGDVHEGLRIGRFIRESLSKTWAFDVPHDRARSPCNSTCFLIWVAGVQRVSVSYGSGALGMHRPYFDPSYFKGLTPKEAEKKQDSAMAEVKDYLLEMDISQRVIDEMMAIPSYDIKRLSVDWVMANIGVVTPGFEEWSVANCGPILTDQERDDFRTIEWLKQTKDFTKSYIEYLRTKEKNTECWERIRKEAQESVFKKMF